MEKTKKTSKTSKKTKVTKPREEPSYGFDGRGYSMGSRSSKIGMERFLANLKVLD